MLADGHQERALIATCNAIVLFASLLVPRKYRIEWKQEWYGEIWHWCHFLSETNRLNTESKIDLVKHCWGAFPDAVWQRLHRDALLLRLEEFLGSPGVSICLVAGLFVATAITCAVCFGRVGPTTINDRIWIAEFDSNVANRSTPLRSDEFFRLAAAWKQSELLDDIAEYSWTSSEAVTPKNRVTISWAQVNPGFFQLVTASPTIGTLFNAHHETGCDDCVVISADLKRLLYGDGPEALGKALTLGGRKRRIIGILPRGFSIVGPGIDAWTLFDRTGPPFRGYMERFGAVIRLRNAVNSNQAQADLNRLSDLSFLCCVKTRIKITSAERKKRQTSFSDLVFLLVAIASVAAVVLGGHANVLFAKQDQTKSSWWWVFFCAKTFFALAAAYMVSLLLAYEVISRFIWTVYPISQQLAVWLFLLFAVLIFPISVQDQRVRCRRCLRILRMPVHIGAFGSLLLDRAGTETVCPVGHGVLYSADFQPSLERDRWTVFDDSWGELFCAGENMNMPGNATQS
jgi:MacB-like periplasmic core domain